MAEIRHEGTVIAVNGHQVKVRITRFSACHNCDARHGCGLMECRDKTICIETENAADFHPGEGVWLSMTPTMGLKAVFYSYLLPLLLMVGTIALASLIGAKELISGISGIIILIPYYFWLFLKTKLLKRQFKFKINKI